MIFNKQGVPLNEVFLRAALLKGEKLKGVVRAVLKDNRHGPYNKTQENARRAPHP